MKIFKKIKEKRVNDLIEAIYKKDMFKRYLLLILGCFIVAFSYNVFFVQLPKKDNAERALDLIRSKLK